MTLSRRVPRERERDLLVKFDIANRQKCSLVSQSSHRDRECTFWAKLFLAAGETRATVEAAEHFFV